MRLTNNYKGWEVPIRSAPGTHDAATPHAMDVAGGGRSSAISCRRTSEVVTSAIVSNGITTARTFRKMFLRLDAQALSAGSRPG
jgi:hypothetical protein